MGRPSAAGSFVWLLLLPTSPSLLCSAHAPLIREEVGLRFGLAADKLEEIIIFSSKI